MILRQRCEGGTKVQKANKSRITGIRRLCAGLYELGQLRKGVRLAETSCQHFKTDRRSIQTVCQIGKDIPCICIKLTAGF